MTPDLDELERQLALYREGISDMSIADWGELLLPLAPSLIRAARENERMRAELNRVLAIDWSRELRELLAAREAEIAELRKEADNEVDRWQTRIENTITLAGLEPFDASGNDSGDPLDWTDDQVSRALSDARAKTLGHVVAYVRLFPGFVPVEAIVGYCDALEDPEVLTGKALAATEESKR
jgi:hypothetical protein